MAGGSGGEFDDGGGDSDIPVFVGEGDGHGGGVVLELVMKKGVV